MIVTINLLNEVETQITGLTASDSYFLYEHYGIEVEGAKFMPIVKLGRWDGKIRFFGKNGLTYVRMLDELIPFFESKGYGLNIIDNRQYIEPIAYRVDENYFDNLAEIKITLRPYQVEMVNLCLEAGSGFLLSCTGSGKTLTCAALGNVLADHGYPTLIIVPSGDLVEQTAETFELCGMEYGVYSGDSKKLGRVTVATWQALQYNPSILSKFKALIVDECHTLTGKVLKDLINQHGGHIAFRYGVTGTFPPSPADEFACKASIGQILYDLPAWKLIELGYLANLEIQPYEIQDKFDKNMEEFPEYDAERAYVNQAPERMEIIASNVMENAGKYGNTLVLVTSVDQGKLLHSMIPNSIFLYGVHLTKARKNIYSRFADEDDLIVIATVGIASTGISINRIFHLCFIDMWGSFTKVIQAIGRGLRKSGDKDFVYCSDIHSNFKFGKKHFNLRNKYYVEAKYPILKKIKIKL
jgi:superfamily II DNA or RNA helicase